jgi:hypothetical protein
MRPVRLLRIGGNRLLVVAVASRCEGRYRRGGENADDHARGARQWTSP